MQTRMNRGTRLMVVTLLGCALAASPSRRLAAQDSVIVIDPDAPAAPAAQRAALDADVLQRAIAFFNGVGTTRLEGIVTLPSGARLTGMVAVWRGPLRVGGTIDGPVVVVNGDLELISGGTIQGDVLVVPCTTPAYNAVLTLAAAVVTADGGPLSHAAVLARELGISAVVGARGALTEIPDGALIDVDPVVGEVRVVSEV